MWRLSGEKQKGATEVEGCPLSTKVAELQDSCLSYEALARISEKSKDRSFLCHGCHVTRLPACSAGFLRGASGIPGCSWLPVGLLGTYNATQPSEQLAHVHEPVPELGIPAHLRMRPVSRGNSPGESGLVSRGSQGLRSPLESRRGSLGAP